MLYRRFTRLQIIHRIPILIKVNQKNTFIFRKMCSTQILKRVDNIVKSCQDKRLYRGLILSNKMKILLVSDDEIDKAAAALDVKVGFMNDPKDIPGLAHFCEHMLFLGTEKYPQENSYTKFLNENGGHSNACTLEDHTYYYFDVIPDKLPAALDRFAQVFLQPLFTKTATERELNAVHAEHEKNISNDVWRLDQLNKHTGDPAHDYHKFGTGNRQTLDIYPKQIGLDIHHALLEFHSKWYSANIMALSVIGKESLDDLETLVVPLFSGVYNREVVAPEWSLHPFQEEHLSTCANVVPIKDVRSLNIVFPTADLHPYYESHPSLYISHLVGHEGPGSLLSLLKARGWSNHLVSGSRNAPRGFGFFAISMDLTEDGLHHTDDIILLLFQYLQMVRQSGLQQWIFEEQKKISAMQFRFKDKESPTSYISTLVQFLQRYPLEEVLCGAYLLKKWAPDLIANILDSFVPKNIRLAIVSKDFAGKTNQIEPWYGTEYIIGKIPLETLQRWENCGLCDELSLPEVNVFIPENFDLFSVETQVNLNKNLNKNEKRPEIIRDSNLFRVWFKQDDEFFLPKLNMSFDFVTPLAYLDPLNCNLTHMFVQLFRDSLNEFAYAADIAGMKWELTNTKYGLILSLSGYSDKQDILLRKISEKLVQFKFEQKRFDILKENHIRNLRNFNAEQPYQHAVYYLAVLLTEHSWTKQELLDATDQLTFDHLENFIPQLLSKLHVECLIHGNANKQKALDLVDIVESHLKQSCQIKALLPRQLLLNRELKLENGCNYLYKVSNEVHSSSCVEIYLQCGLQTQKLNIFLELLAQILYEPFFDQLRTKEQLGYIIFSGIRRSNGVQGLRFIVQSDKHPQYVDHRIELFLDKFEELLTEMNDEEFHRHVQALAAKRLEKPKRLSTLTAQFWSEITSQQYHFNRTTEEVAFLLNSQYVHRLLLLQFYQDQISPKSINRHKLTVYVLSKIHEQYDDDDDEEEEEEKEKEFVEKIKDESSTRTINIIKDVTVFKSEHEMFPLAQPYIQILRKGNNQCKL